jgi:hypothetical protein
MAIEYIFPKSPDPLLKTGIDTSSARIGHLNKLVDQVNASSQFNFYCNRDISKSSLYVSSRQIVSKLDNQNGIQKFHSDTYTILSVYSGFESNDSFIFSEDSNVVEVSLQNQNSLATGVTLKFFNSDFDSKNILPVFNLRGIDYMNIESLYAQYIDVSDPRSGLSTHPVFNAFNLLSVEDSIVISGFDEFNCPNLEEIKGKFSTGFRITSTIYSTSVNLLKLKRTPAIFMVYVDAPVGFTLNLPSIEYTRSIVLINVNNLQTFNFSSPNGLKGLPSIENSSNFDCALENLNSISATSIDNIILRIKEMFQNAVGILPSSSFNITVANCNSYSPSIAAREALDYLIALPGANINVQGY